MSEDESVDESVNESVEEWEEWNELETQFHTILQCNEDALSSLQHIQSDLSSIQIMHNGTPCELEEIINQLHQQSMDAPSFWSQLLKVIKLIPENE
jgi:DNA repair ATPase RecN